MLIARAAARSDSSEPRASGPLPPRRNPPPPRVRTRAAGVTAGGQAVNAQGAATLEFKKRIEAYLKIHNEAEGKVPNLKRTDDPKEISDREKALGRHDHDAARRRASPARSSRPSTSRTSSRSSRTISRRRSAADRKALINELPKNIKVDINTVYPTTLPLETFPPALLRKLPDLPPELEYRIVGRSLILRDVKANLIVDILRDVVPTIPS